MINAKTNLIAAIACFILMSGCVTSKKIDGWIESQESAPSKLKTSDYIMVKTDLVKSDTVSQTKRGKHKLLPLILYWRSETSWVSTLNPWVPLNTFNSGVIQYANAKGLKTKLNGQKLEISFDKLPQTFALTSIVHMVILGVYYVRWFNEFANPEIQNVSLKYRLLKDNVETKTGIINIADPNKAERLKMFQSYKKLTLNYLEKYDINIQAMSREFVDKLISEL